MSSPATGFQRLSVPKAIGWSIAFMLLGVAVSGLVMSLWARLVYGDLLQGLRTMTEPGPTPFVAAGVSQVIGFAFATWAVGFRALGLRRSDLRWAGPRIGLRGLGMGLAFGAIAAGVALLSAVLVADSHWSRDTGDLGDYVSQVAKTSLVLAPAALSEEVMFRGIPLVLMSAAIGRGTALVVVAGIIFALFHALNPGITPLGLGNIALAGIFLGLAFYAPGGLWTAFGAHLGWNATLAALDAPVSGLPFRIPFIDYHAGDPVWLSGGRFGPEGGLLGTVALTAALLVMVRVARKDST